MIALTLTDVARVTGGRLVGANCAFDAVSIDTRTLAPGALFVALKGPNFDAHDFAEQALKQGAVGALVERELSLPMPQVVAVDALRALAEFARAWRESFAIPVVGVTGSNGKTTTKEMIGAILSLRGPCLVTQGNLNNHIGVPLMLLRLSAAHRAAVIEMGANHEGEIAALTALAQPTVGVITNAGAAHLEGFGDLDGVARGKGELFRALGTDGVAVVNADDAYADYWRKPTRARVLTFGLQHAADFGARSVRKTAGDEAAYSFEMTTPLGAREMRLALAGEHNLRNALGAAAAAYAAGADLDDIARGLAAMRAVNGRLQIKPAKQGAHLIDDSYNANPSSVRAGVDALRTLAGRHWLIFGDMMELGAQADELHAQIGEYARQRGVERLWTVGAKAKLASQAFGAGAEHFADLDALTAAVQRELAADVTVLIKGSRANRLERVVAALSAAPMAANGH